MIVFDCYSVDSTCRIILLDKPYLVDPDLMHHIIGIPLESKDPATALQEKGVDKKATYKKYNTKRGICGMTISLINNWLVLFMI